ncbi:hypothetical protein QFB84_00645 [Enterobacter hormaechei]|uniref:hypothetical protein n=1 Tax=Enterobacter hormaechei TaxID=158836 RepID=UPI0021C01459|nr:hypothetical protein [Enterobacter hormaechei]UXI64037.1 hypothetical protein N5934_09355 [Enterobacter hormaechei]WGL86954.1 hypothetical protein QFB84_00645 [Enterobacter hormaechei]
MGLNKKEDDHKAQKKRVGPVSEAPPGNDWHRREQKSRVAATPYPAYIQYASK